MFSSVTHKSQIPRIRHLFAESTTSAIYCAEADSEPGEDVWLKATRALLAKIENGGCEMSKREGSENEAEGI